MSKYFTGLFILLFFQTVQAETNRELYNSRKITKEERLIYNMEFELHRSCDPKTNELPQNIRQKELNFVKRIPTIDESITAKKLSGDQIMSSPDWKARGPWNTGGRFLCIEFDSQNENIINAGAASGGMWRSVDKGLSWVKTSDIMTVQSVYCLVQDKRKGKTNIWYYGTGEMLSTTDRSVSLRARTMNTGGGIWKSTDNGATWFPLQSTLGGNPAFPDNPFQGVWSIVIDNKSIGDVVYAACYGGIYRSVDGGETWRLVLGDTVNRPFSSYIVQNSYGILFTGLSPITLTGKKPSKYGIYRSSDTGDQWTKITPPGFSDTIRTIKMAIAPVNPNTLYLLAEKPSTGIDPYYFGSGIRNHFFWKYTDNPGSGTGTWINRSSFIPNNAQKVAGFNSLGSYCLTLIVKPDDENTVILGGTNVYVSTNGFSSNSNVTHIGGYYTWGGYDLENIFCHPDIHGFAIPKSNSKALYVANDGGVHVTDDYTVTQPEWVSLNNGLLGSQFYTVSIDHASPADPFIFGGLQDNSSQLTFSEDMHKPWPAVIGGDGMASAVANGKDFILGSWYNGSVVSYRYDKDTVDIDYIYQTPENLGTNNFEFYTLFALDRNNNSLFYLPAKNNLYRKDNLAAATRDTNLVNTGWNRIAQINAGTSITALGLSVQPANVLYFGTNNGKIYKITNSADASPGLKEITGQSMPANAFCSCIDVDPKNADDILVAFSNYHVESIFHSSDGGSTFEPVSGNLEEIPEGEGAGPGVRKVMKVYVGNNPVWFAATTSGLFSTTRLNGPSTEWVREGSETIGNVIVDWIDARQDEGFVVIGTQGAGVFSVKYPVVGVEIERTYGFSLSECVPNPASDNLEIAFTLENESSVLMNLYDVNGKVITVLADAVYPRGRSSVVFNASGLSSGAYFYTLINGNKRITKRMIIVR